MWLVRIPQHQRHAAIDLSVASPSSLVRQRSSLSEAGQAQTVLDRRCSALVEGQQCYRANSSWNEEKSIGIATLDTRQEACQRHRHGHTGQVVVAERGVTYVARNQYLVRLSARKNALTKR